MERARRVKDGSKGVGLGTVEQAGRGKTTKETTRRKVHGTQRR